MEKLEVVLQIFRTTNRSTPTGCNNHTVLIFRSIICSRSKTVVKDTVQRNSIGRQRHRIATVFIQLFSERDIQTKNRDVTYEVGIMLIPDSGLLRGHTICIISGTFTGHNFCSLVSFWDTFNPLGNLVYRD